MQQDLTPSQKAKITKANKKVAEEVRNLYINLNHGERDRWQTREQKSYDFSLNEQLTQEELDTLRASGMPDFIINRITPIIETMKYFITANRPRYKAVGVDGSDSKMAKIHESVMDYSWYISNGQAMMSAIIDDVLRKSKGYFHIVVDPDADHGLGEVKIERVDPFDVFVSNNSTDPYERDASQQMIKKDYSRTELIQMLPEYESEIRAAQGEEDANYNTERQMDEPLSTQHQDLQSPVRNDGTEDDLLPYYEVYEPVSIRFVNMMTVNTPSKEELEKIREAIDAQVESIAEELSVQASEKLVELQEAYSEGEINDERFSLESKKINENLKQKVIDIRQDLLNKAIDKFSKVESDIVTEDEYNKLKEKLGDRIKEAIPFYEQRIRKTCVVGDRLLYRSILDITCSPLIAIPYTHTGTPMPMSAVTPLVGKQREINKAHQIMIHNANLASSVRYKYVEGEIDEHTWATRGASPGALLPYRPGFSSEGPKEILPQNINSAFYAIENDAKIDMEYTAGIQPPSMGISNSNDETYRGFLAKDEYGTRRVRSWVQNVLEPGLDQVGKVFQELAKNTYSINKILRIVNPTQEGGLQVDEFEINVPIYDEISGELIGRANDYASTRYDIRVISGSTLPVNRWAVLEEKKEWLQLGVIDDIAFLKETDIPDKESIMKRKAMLSQLQGRVNQLEEAVKDRDGTIETLTRQIVQSGIEKQIMKAQIEVDRSKTQLKSANKMAENDLRKQVQGAISAPKMNKGQKSS